MTPMNSPDTRRLDFHYIALQSGFWAMFAAICGYQAALLQGRGFTNSQIGVLIAVRCLAGIVLQPLLGGWADRHPNVPLKAIVNLSPPFPGGESGVYPSSRHGVSPHGGGFCGTGRF